MPAGQSISRFRALTSLFLSFSLPLSLSGSFFHSLLLSFFPTCHSCNLIVSINFVVAATRRQTVVHFAAGVASVNSFAHPSSLRSHSPKQYATQIFHYCNCRHLAASRYRYSCHSMRRRSFRFLPHCALRFAKNNTSIFHFIIIKAFELH